MAQRFGVVDRSLFGFFARDQTTDASDMDILVPSRSSITWGTR